MGIFVKLNILPQQIDSKAWQECYEKTIKFLEDPTVAAMGIQRQNIYSMERRVFSRKIEHEIEDPTKRFWNVLGDFKTKERAESFILHYDIHYYLSDRLKHSEDTNILTSFLDHKTISVFSDKTQGYSYHIPMLAVAMLIEDRFPNAAIVSGDIDKEQAIDAQKLLKQVLNQFIKLPIVVDSEVLYNRLLKQFPEQNIIGSFLDIHRGDISFAYQTILKHSGKEELRQWMMADLKRYYSDPTQLGAIDYMIQWLNATQDLETLCQMACLDPDGPQYSPVEFTSGLVSTWISIDRNSRTPQVKMDSVSNQFLSAFQDLAGFKGRNNNTHLPQDQVLSILNKLFPTDFEQIREIFEKKSKRVNRELNQMWKQYDTPRIETENITDDSVTSEPDDQDLDKKMIQHIARIFKKTQDNFRTQYQELHTQSIEQIKKTITRLSSEQGLVFTEDAWQWIDIEDNKKLLELVMLFVAISDNTLQFYNMRNMVLEDRKICSEILNMMENPSDIIPQGEHLQ